MHRRQFIAGAAGLIAGSLAPRLAIADVPTAFTFDMAPPMDNREKFVAWGVAQRGEDPKYLGERFDRFGAMHAMAFGDQIAHQRERVGVFVDHEQIQSARDDDLD